MGRRLTTAITMLVLGGLLVGAAVWGWNSMLADVPSTRETVEKPSTCTTERLRSGQRLRPRRVLVSVFNAGTETGLAESTLAKLRRRGFRTGQAGNAPSDAGIDRVQVWSTRQNDVGARLVSRQFRGRVRVRFSDEDLGPGVDVVVGNDLNRLAPRVRSIRVRKAQDVCVRPPRSRNR